MGIIQKIESINPPILVDFLRIALGGFITYKGIVFVSNFDSFTANIQSVGWVFVAAHLAHAIIFIHMAGGIILMTGALTRWMCLLNIPILAGAVIFNYKQMLTADNYMELPMAAITLGALILVAITGSGKFSLDYIREQRIKMKSATSG
ncbi:DoxX family protein [Ekhidna sp.]|uniref:DoxX family protein n=1 Tax=Ekhidna sp. TaxID=2608089 RepID=UPI003B5ADF7D